MKKTTLKPNSKLKKAMQNHRTFNDGDDRTIYPTSKIIGRATATGSCSINGNIVIESSIGADKFKAIMALAKANRELAKAINGMHTKATISHNTITGADTAISINSNG